MVHLELGGKNPVILLDDAAIPLAVDGVLFGLAHWELYQFAGLAAFGMLLAFISYKTGRLGMNMVTHASFNFLAVLVVFTTSGGVVH
jgi:membrane protease YdiL (CAAX protease family)